MIIIMTDSKKEMTEQKKEANGLNQLQQQEMTDQKKEMTESTEQPQEEKTKSEIQQNPTASETVMISELAVDNEYLDKFKILLADRYSQYLADVAAGNHATWLEQYPNYAFYVLKDMIRNLIDKNTHVGSNLDAVLDESKTIMINAHPNINDSWNAAVVEKLCDEFSSYTSAFKLLLLILMLFTEICNEKRKSKDTRKQLLHIHELLEEIPDKIEQVELPIPRDYTQLSTVPNNINDPKNTVKKSLTGSLDMVKLMLKQLDKLDLS